ncbi:MAG TPA: delta-lactam-biosynthetic de-N-acetylase [Clostridiaceae bacterium]|nr:delta-lactam-biosynthetic de-N-acetylase [Clostridiaceae bacterium]
MEDVTNNDNEDTQSANDNETGDEKPDNNNVGDNANKGNGNNGQANGEDKKPEGDNEETTQDKEELPVNPKEPNVEKLDVEALNKLDNTKYSWWIKLNSEHKTPEINSNIKEMIDKYDGIYVGDTSKKVIYLTFDEGYENGYTPKILDVLKENDVKTIFFVTGSYIDRNPELIQRMLDEGHQIGNHSISHPSLPDVDYEKLEQELLGLDDKLYEKFGVRTKYMRPPSGEYSERVLAAAQQLGYKTIFWSFAYDDWYADKIRGADYAYNKVMANLHNGAVMLLHAVSKDNADALDRIIKDIKAQGYEIRPFDL